MAEVWAYENLLKTGINIPEMVEYNEEGGYLVKEYINGKTAAELAVEGSLIEPQFESAFELAGKLYAHKMNVDFFPTNFVYDGTDIFLVDYEFNSYIEEWDLENWGIYFWLNGDGMKEHLEKGFSDKLCLPNSPKPVKDGLEEKAQYLIAKYSRKNR
jgi:tRNA A-37 threonylcarbamoyl transferase component Bud32